MIILRTFSKLYGMAGLRAGAALGRPDLLAKLRDYGAGALPVTGMVGAIASLKVKGLVEQRRNAIAEIREQTAGWLVKKGFAVLPSEANMLMVDVQQARPRGLPGPAQGEGRHRPDLAVDAQSRADHDRHQRRDGEIPGGLRARHECLSRPSGRRGRADRGLWLARPGRGRTGRRNRRAGCASLRIGPGEADGAAAGAGSLHVDPDRARHVAASAAIRS